MFDVLNSISVHVLQLPTDKNGRIAIVSASIVMPDGRIVSDVCSASPRSPFENEDTLEIAKNRVINVVKQKADPISKIIKTSLKMPLRTIRIDSGEEASLPAVINSPSFATRLRNKGKIQKSLPKRVSSCFWKKVLIRSRVFSISISPIPPCSLIQAKKLNWAAREAVFSGHGRTPKSMAFSPAVAISPNRWHARLTCPEAAFGHTS